MLRSGVLACACLCALLLAACTSDIAGLTCKADGDCAAGERCTDSICVVVADAATAGRDASTSEDGGALELDASHSDSGPADSGHAADVGPAKPDAGTPDVGSPDVGSPDVGSADAGVPDVGTPDAGPTCGPNEQWVGNQCLQVFRVQIDQPLGTSKTHASALVTLVRDSPTNLPPPKTITLTSSHVRSGATFDLALDPLATDPLTFTPRNGAGWVVAKSGEWHLWATFNLGGTFSSQATAKKVQVQIGALPAVGAYGPSRDPGAPTGAFVRGVQGTILVPVDVDNVDGPSSSVTLSSSSQIPLALGAQVACGAVAACPCAPTVVACVAATTDFFEGGKLALDLRGGYPVGGQLRDLDGQSVGVTGTIAATRVRWTFETGALFPYAPMAVLDDGTLVVGTSSADPASPGTSLGSSYQLQLVTADGHALWAQDVVGGGLIRSLSVGRIGGEQFVLLLVTNPGAGPAASSSSVAYAKIASGAIGSTSSVLATLEGVSAAWSGWDKAQNGYTDVVLATTLLGKVSLRSWTPAKGLGAPSSFLAIASLPHPPLVVDNGLVWVGSTNGSIYPCTESSGSFICDTASPFPTGGKSVAAFVPSSNTTFAGYALDSNAAEIFLSPKSLSADLTDLPVSGFALEGTSAYLLGADGLHIGDLSSDQVPLTSYSLPLNHHSFEGLALGKSGTAYLTARDASSGTSNQAKIVRFDPSSAKAGAAWPISASRMGPPALDCQHLASAASSPLGTLYLPVANTAKNSVWAIVVDDPGPNPNPGGWPLPGRSQTLTYNMQAPISACP